MKPTTKEEWIGYLASLEKLSLQHEDELKKRIAEGITHRIEQASVAFLHCSQRVEAAKKAIADYG